LPHFLPDLTASILLLNLPTFFCLHICKQRRCRDIHQTYPFSSRDFEIKNEIYRNPKKFVLLYKQLIGYQQVWALKRDKWTNINIQDMISIVISVI
jgi:hypothetical protein